MASVDDEKGWYVRSVLNKDKNDEELIKSQKK